MSEKKLVRVLRRGAFLVAIALFVSLLVVGGEYLRWVELEHRFTTISEGAYYQSAQMSPDALIALAREKEIDAVVDLRDTTDDLDLVRAEGEALTAAGIEHIHLPTNMQPDAEAVAAFLDIVAAQRGAGRTLLVHCHHGEGRSVLYSALYRVQFEGWTPEEALEAMVRLPSSLMWLNDLVPSLAAIQRDDRKGELLFDRSADSVSPERWPQEAGAPPPGES